MCEILLFVVDRRNRDDPIRDAQLFKAGDVITIQEDGHQWGRDDLANPDWMILKLPNVAVASAASLLTPELEDNPQAPSPVRQKRGFRIDLQALVSDGVGPTDGQGKRADRTITLGATAFLARYRKRVAARQNPLRL